MREKARALTDSKFSLSVTTLIKSQFTLYSRDTYQNSNRKL